MQISIAGAGAGKTTRIADSIIECYENCENNKIVFCIAYTNNAAECIENKIRLHYGQMPDRIHISTIHSFLYQELIKPYYYLLYGVHFDNISIKDISNIKPQYKKAEFKKLEEKGYLHVEAISERAKWVFVKKSSDNKEIKNKRKIIQNTFKAYCGGIFLDEAQDINDDIFEIFVKFYELGLNVNMMGDPKQDLRGYNNLPKIVQLYPKSVSYIVDCYRCPAVHLALSNVFVEQTEQQISKSEKIGSLKYVYESDITLQSYIDDNNFGLIYISTKNGKFDTHGPSKTEVDEALFRDLENIFLTAYPEDDKKKISRAAYYYAEKMHTEIQQGNEVGKVINSFIKELKTQISKREYASLAGTLNNLMGVQRKTGVVVSSIEAIKGMEDSDCLFILTPDLASYLLLEKKDENKTKHKLYVALTRSTENLSILITEETEKKYGREAIDASLSPYISNG